MFDAVTDLISDDGFQTGLVFGLVAAVAVGLAAAIARPVRPWAGLAFGAAAVVAMADQFASADRFPVTGDLVVGLAVLAAGGVVAGRWPLAVRMAAAGPGAVLVARSTDVTEPGWAVPTIVVATVVGGALAGDCDRTLGRWGLPPVMLAATVLGVYGTTPDTEHAMVLAGASLAIALLGWPRPLASLGVAGSFVAAALVSWTAVVDGLGRPGAVVGAVACLGVLAVEPVVRRAVSARRRLGRSSLTARDALVVGALHLGLVAACSRVAGLRTSAGQALAISAFAYALVAGALVAVSVRSPSGGHAK
jgi:hypothetical protein